MPQIDSSRLGVWGRREEARELWSNCFSDVTVYSCDILSTEFQRGGVGSIRWLSKYQNGDIWFEYYGVLHGQRPTYFHSIVEVLPQETIGLKIETPVNGATNRDSMFVGITDFVKLPEGIVPKSIPSVLRLKVFDDLDCIARHVPCELTETLFGFGGVVGQNREHNIELEITADDMALIHKIVLFRDCIWVGPAELNVRGIKFLKMFVRPSYFESEIVKAIGPYDGSVGG